MQELIDQLTAKAGLTADQATKAIATIKDFVKEKFPMMAGAVDNLLGDQPAPAAATTTATAETPQSGGSFLDKISDFIPGDIGQKIEDFAKNAEHKAEDAISGIKDKLAGGNK
jgi:hypothetical protein